MGFDRTRGVVSLDESYINLDSACHILKDAIEQNKLIQLPISIQKILIAYLEAVSKYQVALINGSDEVVNLSDAIEKLNTAIWQYGLHNLSDEVLGYQTKLNQLKELELAAIKNRAELQAGIGVKESLEHILEEAYEQSESLQAFVSNASIALEQAKEASTKTIELSQQSAALTAETMKNKEASAEELAIAADNNAKVSAHEKNIDALVTDFVSLKKELNENREEQESLFGEFENYRHQVEVLLGDANRTGMAASFHIRKKELADPLKYWLMLFACSILGLVVMGVVYLAPLLDSGKLEQLPFRLAMVAPFIWLGWFAAKQYGYTARVREDYAYKEASALSFEGFKREAIKVGDEMHQNLMDTAIKNLGENPIRIYSGHGNHASPLHEVLEKSLKDEKLIDLIKAIITKVKVGS